MYVFGQDFACAMLGAPMSNIHVWRPRYLNGVDYHDTACSLPLIADIGSNEEATASPKSIGIDDSYSPYTEVSGVWTIDLTKKWVTQSPVIAYEIQTPADTDQLK